MIALISAMNVEIEALRAKMTEKKKQEGMPFDILSGKLFGRDTVTAVCGPGKVNAALCTQALLLGWHPSCVINMGVGGALAADLKIGDIIIGSYAVQHDMDTSPLGDPAGFISGINQVHLPCDENLVSLFEDTLKKTKGLSGRVGVIATGDQFICSKADKDRITRVFGADTCEMEGGAVAHACYIYQTPCLVLRAMSDQADGEATMNYPQFTALAAGNTATLMSLIYPFLP